MPVRQLDAFLADTPCVRHDAIATLKGARIAVDGLHWIRRILKRFPQDTLVEVTGGVTGTLGPALENELKAARYAPRSNMKRRWCQQAHPRGPPPG